MSSAFVTLKMALFAPIPIASERMATAVKPRDFGEHAQPVPDVIPPALE